ncbi:MAG: acyl-CoA dehydratase activase [Planctomycetes bacterium]|nr:acyl-CoA dehydratase activase [Planctomycetota bacterium]
MIALGVDLGSRTTKAALLANGAIRRRAVVPTGWDPRAAALRARDAVLAEEGIAAPSIGAVVATGYGRVTVPFEARAVTEITCHAAGLHRVLPEVRTVIDVGGQDCKVIRVDRFGLVADFAMNDRCAAGTGRFLEFMAAGMEVPLPEFARLGVEGQDPADLSSICTIFAESEVLSLLAEGRAIPDVVAGLHRAIARRIVALASGVGVAPPVAMTGGGALNGALRRHLADLLRTEILVPDHPQTIGAEGAAFLALTHPGPGPEPPV